MIERLLAPYEEQLQQAESMPGWGRRSAQDALAETGADMTRFPTGGAPGLLGRAHPAGQPVRQARRDAPGPRRATGTWAPSPARPPSRPARPQTREGARYRRLARRRGKAKALVAVGNTQLKVYHKLLSNPGMRYQDLGAGLLRAPARAPAGRSPTTSASSAPSASKSPSAASPNPTQTGQASTQAA